MTKVFYERFPESPIFHFWFSPAMKSETQTPIKTLYRPLGYEYSRPEAQK